MTEVRQFSPLLAAQIALCALASGYFTVLSVISNAAGNLQYMAATNNPNMPPPETFGSQILRNIATPASVIVAALIAIWAFRNARDRCSRSINFHVCFVFGFTLFTYAAWAFIMLLRIISKSPQYTIIAITGSGLMICAFFVPVALLLMVAATFYDINSHSTRSMGTTYV